MSNIYARRIDYDVLPSGKRVLERPEKIVIPNYIVEGNRQPDLSFQVNRKLQPISTTKKPLLQTPFVPKQPVNASGLGGRQPYYIDYVGMPMASFKTRPPKGLVWEPNSIRETRLNVYPDGVPKNLSQLQAADSQYLEQLNNDKKRKDGEDRLKRLVAGRARPLPDPVEEKLAKELEDVIAEGKYGKGIYKNVALSAEGHAKLAQQQADAIRTELNKLRAEGRVHKSDVVKAIESTTIMSGESAKEFPMGDPAEAKTKAEESNINKANKIITDFEDNKTTARGTFSFTGPGDRVDLMTALLISNGLTPDEAEYQSIKLLNSGDISRITSVSQWKKLAAIYSLPKKMSDMRNEYTVYSAEVKAGKIKPLAPIAPKVPPSKVIAPKK